MTYRVAVVLALAALWVFAVMLYRRQEALISALANLANGFTEHQKWVVAEIKGLDEENELIEKRVTEAEKRLDDMPVEELREVADREAAFMDGLDNIMGYGLENYGLNKDGVKHE